ERAGDPEQRWNPLTPGCPRRIVEERMAEVEPDVRRPGEAGRGREPQDAEPPAVARAAAELQLVDRAQRREENSCREEEPTGEESVRAEHVRRPGEPFGRAHSDPR